MKITVIGLGYVGLPLSMQFARSCVSVLGLDVDPKKVQLLDDGQSYIKHIRSAEIAELVAASSSDWHISRMSMMNANHRATF